MSSDAYKVFSWNEVARIEIRGNRIVAKDAMILLDADEAEPGWPAVTVSPGDYVAELHLPSSWHCTRFRIRRTDATPDLGPQVGCFGVDHGKAAFIDYDAFHEKIAVDPGDYEEWTMNELDDELAINFSGEIPFSDTSLIYVKSGDGDGTYPVFQLIENGQVVGAECVFDAAVG